MAILGAYIVPHPPVLLPEVGKDETLKLAATTNGYMEAAKSIKEAAPDTIVIISSHMELYSDYFHIAPGKTISGNMGEFGAEEVSFTIEYDEELRDGLTALCMESNVAAGTLGSVLKTLDHGTMIPLYFLRKAYGDTPFPKFVRVGISGLLLHEHYRLGMLIRQAAEKIGKNIVVIASGDLSHMMSEASPYGFAKEGPIYDEKLMAAMEKADFEELFSFEPEFLEKAAECGHSCFAMLAGALDCIEVKARKLSYEGPFGIGYGIVSFTPIKQEATAGKSFYELYTSRIRDDIEVVRAAEDAYTGLARKALESFVRYSAETGSEGSIQRFIRTDTISNLSKEMPEELRKRRAGCFVCIKKLGRLRGCIGTIEPVLTNVGEEIITNAISVAINDTRFEPVSVDELDFLTYSVDVMGEAEVVASVDELDAKRYGVIVTSGDKRGVLLPDLEGVDTVSEQLMYAKQKAGIKDNEKVAIKRFEVERHPVKED